MTIYKNLLKHKKELISLSETHLQNDSNIELLSLEGYTFLGRCRQNGSGGGVCCIYIKNNIDFKNTQTYQSSLLKVFG